MATIIPVLRMFDYGKAVEFYSEWLGFTVDWEHRFGENFPLYMQVSLKDVVLHLSEHYGDCSPGAKIQIQNFEGLEDFHRELKAKDYRYFKPGLEKAFWDEKVLEMTLTDPFKNVLIFSERPEPA